MRYIFIIAVILLFANGCTSTQNISWEVSQTDAEIQLPANARTITLVNRIRLDYPYNQTNSTVLNPNVPNVMQNALSGVRNQIRSQGFLQVNRTSEIYKLSAPKTFPDLLSPTQIKTAAQGSDLVLCLSMLQQSIVDDYKVEIRRVDLGNNIYKEVDMYIGRRNIPVKLGWRLYDAKTGKLIDQWSKEENYFYEAESRERIRTTNLLNANYQRELNNLGSYFGQLYGTRISPISHRRSLPLYTDGSDYIRKGYLAAISEDWSGAINDWTSGLSKETKAKKKAMLYHNLAVASERLGQNAQARNYAQKAANLHPLGVETQSRVGFL